VTAYIVVEHGRNEKGDIMITLRILNETGHTQVEMASSEVIEQIDNHPTHWIFVDGEMISRQDISSINWDTVASIDLTPAIVGGSL
jgi:hypothetical protein